MKSNPMIRKGLGQTHSYTGEAMSVAGTRNKTLLLMSITFIIALLAYLVCYNGGQPNFQLANTISITSSVIGLILIIGMMFKPQAAKTFAFIYAVTEGLFVGAITVTFSYYFDGVVPKAIILTVLAVIFTILLYKEAPTLASKIRSGVIILTFTILLASILGIAFYALGFGNVLYGTSPISIGFSMLVVLVAIANLMLDYDNVIYGSRMNLPKHMEYFFAVGILVTVVWVYVEMLKLLAKLAARSSD
ncbi:MAG: hypothetical protein BEN19_02120 [Epulopiscium sp. Nuni2H_MBin003]|nr:MAG: hypothetical protein BEN19_02120 [Epulopiscium sp. Nuni2H_MBin003]